NSKFLGPEGANLFKTWIRDQVDKNVPYNEFVYKILTATGSNKENPAASYYKILRTPEDLVENTTHLFLATRFNCNKCHDHPFEKWNVDNYYQTAAFFSQIGLERDEENAADKDIGGSAVENKQPLYEIISDVDEGEVTNIVTGVSADPTYPYSASVNLVKWTGKAEKPEDEPSRRERLAAWIVAADNQFFAKSYANRIWGYLTGTGIIEPIDDIRAGNPPTNPVLLKYLTDTFVDSGFDVRALMREICNSRTYQLSIETNPFNEDDGINYSHGKARRLPAEVLYDAVHVVTGSVPNFPGAKPGIRASQLADVALDTKSGFLANLGRPTRESACECDRTNDVQLSSVMSLLSGPAIAEAVGDRNNAIARLVQNESDDAKLIEKIYLRVLNRNPQATEVALVQNNWQQIEQDHQSLLKQLAEMESDWVYRKSVLETRRYEEITRAQDEIDAYMPEYQEQLAAARKARKQRIKETEEALASYEKGHLPDHIKSAVQSVTVDRFWTQWNTLHPAKAEAARQVEVKLNEDGSIIASGDFGNSVEYTLTIPLKNQTLTGLMLEALTDDALPGFGPGIRESGGFVISEIQGSFSKVENPKPKQIQKLAFSDAEADYTAEGYDVKAIFNGKTERNDKAWSTAGQGHRPHWVRLKLEEALKVDEAGGYLELTVICRYSDGDWPIGKFRMLATDSSDPLNLGLPTAVAGILGKAPVDRSWEEQAAIGEWIKYQDPEYLEKRYESVVAKRPLPPDEKMEALKAALAKVEQPVPDDPVLVQLRKDVQYSSQQAANSRLTAAQDLAWALINNSAFIFNH
ncbi:MAG: DUF1553 domain-containing protein, partial [Verrucomicrobiae bacterium]|nr:DUF1553 domain-containing protein [Verrucomicrobiae bacterium]